MMNTNNRAQNPCQMRQNRSRPRRAKGISPRGAMTEKQQRSRPVFTHFAPWFSGNGVSRRRSAEALAKEDGTPHQTKEVEPRLEPRPKIPAFSLPKACKFGSRTRLSGDGVSRVGLASNRKRSPRTKIASLPPFRNKIENPSLLSPVKTER
ncbi:MAG: hypothetical protein JWM04_206 [Verrucomicrobiales bacterium]|nr:hypothetical protein [Verrucomicrobiales bacterium]